MVSLITAGWIGALLFLAATTANPITVNREQLLSSDAVVVSVADDSAEVGMGLFVEQILVVQPGVSIPSPLRVGGVEKERFEPGTRYVVPLKRDGQRWIVAPAPAAFDNEPLVYPGTRETVQVAEKILSTAAAKPYE